MAPGSTALRYEGSTPSATTICATRSRARSATSADEDRRRVRAGARPVLRVHRHRDRRRDGRAGARTTCCWSCRASAWSRSTPIKRLLGRLLGDPISGTHERAPDGFLLAYGTSVEPGRLPRGSIVDVAPTCSTSSGLPVGRDMDGFARTDLFTRAFTAERPIAFIPTYSRYSVPSFQLSSRIVGSADPASRTCVTMLSNSLTRS